MWRMMRDQKILPQKNLKIKNILNVFKRALIALTSPIWAPLLLILGIIITFVCVIAEIFYGIFSYIVYGKWEKLQLYKKPHNNSFEDDV